MSVEVPLAIKILSIVGSVTGSASVIGSTWFWYDKRKEDRRTEEMQNRLNIVEKGQTEHAAKFVTSDQTRQIVREETAGIKEDLAETKTTVQRVASAVDELVTEFRVFNAVQEEKERQRGG